MKYKAILFDFDGTLADTLHLYVQAYSQTLQSFGFTLADKEVIGSCFGKTEETICKNLGIPEKTHAFKETYFATVKRLFFARTKLFPYASEVLQNMQAKGLQLGITTFSHKWYINEMLSHCKLEGYFQSVVSFDDVTKAKPDPEAVFLSCGKLKVSPAETLVIGDSSSDIKMGKAAGVTTILFEPKEHSDIYDFFLLEQTNPDHTIHSWSEGKKLLEELLIL